MGMGPLAGFEQNSITQGDKLKASDAAGWPLLVFVVDKKEHMNTEHGKDKTGLIVDIFNMQNQEIFSHVLWLNNQIVDNLERYVGQAVAIRIEWRDSKNGNGKYILPVALVGEEAAIAGQWVAAKPDMFDEDRAKKGYPSTAEVRGSNIPAAVQPAAKPAAATAVAPPAAAVSPSRRVCPPCGCRSSPHVRA